MLRAVWTLVPSFAGTAQQDAHEFMRFLLERLRMEFVRGEKLATAAQAKANARRQLLPRGREHGEGSNVMMDLGIPVPLRRTRSLRSRKGSGQWGGGDSGANTPELSNSPDPKHHQQSARIGGGGAGAVSLHIAATTAAAAIAAEAREMEGGSGSGSAVGITEGLGGDAVKIQNGTANRPDESEDEQGGYIIVSRWGAVRHKFGCVCRPCKSRRKAEGGGGPASPPRTGGTGRDATKTGPVKDEALTDAVRAVGSSGTLEAAAAGAASQTGSGGEGGDAVGEGGGGEKDTEAPPTFQVKTRRISSNAVTTNAAVELGPSAPVAPVEKSEGDESKPGGRSDTDAEAEPGSSGASGANGVEDGLLPADIVWKLFGGMALSRICCQRCGHASTRREPYLDISLPIPPVVGTDGIASPRSPSTPTTPSSREVPEVGEGPGGCVTLQQCLGAHTRNEKLSGPGRYYCERCGGVGGATKQTKLQTLPPILCLHLKRFTWRGTGARSKLNSHVDFPLEGLDLAPHLEIEDASGSPGPTTKAAAETAVVAAAAAAEMAAVAAEVAAAAAPNSLSQRPRRNSSNARETSAAAKAAAAQIASEEAAAAAAAAVAAASGANGGAKNVCAASPKIYDLAAVVMHHGAGAASGHYTVYVRDSSGGGGEGSTGGPGGDWLHFNDEKVEEVSPEEVKSSGGYLFFYTRRPEAPPEEGGGEIANRVASKQS